MSIKSETRIGIVADQSELATRVAEEYIRKFSFIDLSREDREVIKGSLDIIIVCGGDGFMLHSLHRFMDLGVEFYGINCGSVGFLLNQYSGDRVLDLIAKGRKTEIKPLIMEGRAEQENFRKLAINEVSLLRQRYQTAHIKVTVKGVVYFEDLICDGLLVATPAGSSAYNYSAGGPVIPIGSNVIALTPLSPFRPRRWQGALLPSDSVVEFEILQQEKRPVSATADFHEIRNVEFVRIYEDSSNKITMIFDQEHSLEDRLIREQFAT